jgi:MFS family permease
LLPQPSDDPNDPLNWTSFKKHSILILVALGSFLGDFGACAGIPTVVVQGIEWNQSPVVINYANNLSAIMCGVSGLVWMPLLNHWGRIPVLFWSTVLGFFFSLGCVLSKDFDTFYAMRGLQVSWISHNDRIVLIPR